MQEKGIREQTITLQCRDVINSQLLNQWNLNYPELRIVGNFVIVERTITDNYDKYKVQLKLKNRGFYSRYGTVYNKNKKEINNLTIRQDDLVLKQSQIGETVTWSDSWTERQSFMTFTPGTTDIFSPFFIDGITPSGGDI